MSIYVEHPASTQWDCIYKNENCGFDFGLCDNCVADREYKCPNDNTPYCTIQVPCDKCYKDLKEEKKQESSAYFSPLFIQDHARTPSPELFEVDHYDPEACTCFDKSLGEGPICYYCHDIHHTIDKNLLRDKLYKSKITFDRLFLDGELTSGEDLIITNTIIRTAIFSMNNRKRRKLNPKE